MNDNCRATLKAPPFKPARSEQDHLLTKREKFAMAAMQGILASQYFSDFCNESELADKRGAAAEVAVKHADALLAELEKPSD